MTRPVSAYSEITRNLDATGDMLAVFRSLLSRHITPRVLLETLSDDGPEGKNLIALDPIVSLRRRAGRHELEGSDALVNQLDRFLTSRGVPPPQKGHEGLLSWDAKDNSVLWQVCRGVRDWFLEMTAQSEQVPSRSLLGWFGAIPYQDLSVADKNDQVDAKYSEFNCFATLIRRSDDNAMQVVQFVSHDSLWGVSDARDIAAAVSSVPRVQDTPAQVLGEPKLEMTAAAFHDRVNRAKEYIMDGDVYQVQIGHTIAAESVEAPIEVYTRLRQINPSPYMYYYVGNDGVHFGGSPEQYMTINHEIIAMRPIAGTFARGSTTGEDDALAESLRSDDKELAEHRMLVDLCRNDIGVVAEPGTLEVPDLLAVEKYSHVTHLVSTVTAVLGSDHDEYDAVRAAFPAGTMTGAPKERAMQIIEELEASPRGMYAGAMGFIFFNGDVNLALCIRGATYRNQEYRYRASAGIVAGSQPESEWAETLRKMSAIHTAVCGTNLIAQIGDSNE